MNLIEFINKSICWQKHTLNDRYFFAYNDGQALLLRMNDFPDEPLLTLIKEVDVMDIDEIPPNWVVPL